MCMNLYINIAAGGFGVAIWWKYFQISEVGQSPAAREGDTLQPGVTQQKCTRQKWIWLLITIQYATKGKTSNFHGRDFEFSPAQQFGRCWLCPRWCRPSLSVCGLLPANSFVPATQATGGRRAAQHHSCRGKASPGRILGSEPRLLESGFLGHWDLCRFQGILLLNQKTPAMSFVFVCWFDLNLFANTEPHYGPFSHY